MGSIVKQKLKFFIILLLGFFLFLCISLKVAIAQPNPEFNAVKSPLEQKISYYVLQQTVNLALKDIGTQINIPVVVASNVKGKVAAGKYEGTARDILNQMVADLNLHWFFDGRAIQVTAVQDAVMHIVQFNSFSFESLKSALIMMNIDINGFPIRYDAYNNMGIVYGPPKYVATIETIAHHLALRSQQKPKVIRG